MINPLNKRKLGGPVKKTTSAQRLARQGTDFTAEGSPPPGRVATEVPAKGESVPTPAADTRSNDPASSAHADTLAGRAR